MTISFGRKRDKIAALPPFPYSSAIYRKSKHQIVDILGDWREMPILLNRSRESKKRRRDEIPGLVPHAPDKLSRQS